MRREVLLRMQYMAIAPGVSLAGKVLVLHPLQLILRNSTTFYELFQWSTVACNMKMLTSSAEKKKWMYSKLVGNLLVPGDQYTIILLNKNHKKV